MELFYKPPPYRFDLAAKYIYVKYIDKNINTDFHKNLYEEHIKTFNNCKELDNGKENIEDFFKSFNKLIENIKDKGFDKSFPITYNKNGLTNGAHRLMTSYYFNIEPFFEKHENELFTHYNYSFFLNREKNPLERFYADSMALEYVNVNKNIRCMVVYPVSNRYRGIQKIRQLINKYGYLYYEKEINLSDRGVNNLIKEMYRGEDWIGDMFPRGWSPGGKAQRCTGKGSTHLLLISMNDTNQLINLKDECRELFKLGKHSLHISDETIDTFRICSSLLNENSIKFLNKGTNDISDKCKKQILSFFKGNRESICFSNPKIVKEMNEEIEINEIVNDEIIFNPKYHFYFNGFKFKCSNN